MDNSKPDCASECLLFIDESEKKEKDIFKSDLKDRFSF